MVTDLSVDLPDDLAGLEAVIEDGLPTFMLIGKALAKIRDDGLYKADYGTFANYVEQRWSRGRNWAYKQIAAARDADVYPGYTSEKAARLARADRSPRRTTGKRRRPDRLVLRDLLEAAREVFRLPSDAVRAVARQEDAAELRNVATLLNRVAELIETVDRREEPRLRAVK